MSPFEQARALGVVDTAVGFPKSRDEMFEFYEFIRKGSHDAATKDGDLEFPAGYMFKNVPTWESDEMGDPVEMLFLELQRHGITQAIVGVEDEAGRRAVRDLAGHVLCEHRYRSERRAWMQCARSTATPTSST